MLQSMGSQRVGHDLPPEQQQQQQQKNINITSMDYIIFLLDSSVSKVCTLSFHNFNSLVIIKLKSIRERVLN